MTTPAPQSVRNPHAAWCEPSPRMTWEQRTNIELAAVRVGQIGIPDAVAELAARELRSWVDCGFPLCGHGVVGRAVDAIHAEWHRQRRAQHVDAAARAAFRGRP